MEQTGTAWFVEYPRMLDDLRRPHLLSAERPYEIVGTAALSGMDYENFCADMAVDRPFLADAAGTCAGGPVWKCLLVRRRGKPGGVLAVPRDGAVWFAAYMTE